MHICRNCWSFGDNLMQKGTEIEQKKKRAMLLRRSFLFKQLLCRLPEGDYKLSRSMSLKYL